MSGQISGIFGLFKQKIVQEKNFKIDPKLIKIWSDFRHFKAFFGENLFSGILANVSCFKFSKISLCNLNQILVNFQNFWQYGNTECEFQRNVRVPRSELWAEKSLKLAIIDRGSWLLWDPEEAQTGAKT